MSSRTIVEVQKTVLFQHAELRAGLQRLGMLADLLNAEHSTERPLRDSLLQFAALFCAHLDFEERELAPRVRELDAWGPVREASLRAEHAAQRTRLHFVCTMADPSVAPEAAGPWKTHFVREVLRLMNDLTVDMREEENWLAHLTEIEEFGDTEQMTG